MKDRPLRGIYPSLFEQNPKSVGYIFFWGGYFFFFFFFFFFFIFFIFFFFFFFFLYTQFFFFVFFVCSAVPLPEECLNNRPLSFQVDATRTLQRLGGASVWHAHLGSWALWRIDQQDHPGFLPSRARLLVPALGVGSPHAGYPGGCIALLPGADPPQASLLGDGAEARCWRALSARFRRVEELLAPAMLAIKSIPVASVQHPGP